MPGATPAGLFSYIGFGGGVVAGGYDLFKVADINNDTGQVTNSWFEVRGTGDYSSFLLSGASSPGGRNCGEEQIMCDVINTPSVRNQMIHSWFESGANGPRAGKNEVGFWVGHNGSGYFPYERHRGEGSVIYNPFRYQPQGSFIWVHVHPFTRGEGFSPWFSGLDMEQLRRNPIIEIIMTHEGIFSFTSTMRRRMGR